QPPSGSGGARVVVAPSGQVVWTGGLRRLAGTQVALAVYASQADPMYALQMRVTYDDKVLRATGVRLTHRTRGAALAFNAKSRGVARVAIARQDAIDPGDGPIAVLTFEAERGVAPAEPVVSVLIENET
ncbi:MAG TPA: cohesin domain-containing protein, partial [Candidatus Acidoferrales bacterium]|nr:cohesin domain-containing protein [Candidatus Acidoferrales bacterium]